MPIRFPSEQPVAGEAGAQGTSRFVVFEIQLDDVLTADIHGSARRLETMPAVIMLTAFVALLSWWSKQNALMVSFISAGREEPEYAHTIGYFAYPLFLRMELDWEESFSGALDRVIRELCAAYEHRDLGRLVTLGAQAKFRAGHPTSKLLTYENHDC